jgi:hypothetical protein
MKKSRIVQFTTAFALVSSLTVISCKESFLDVSNPTVLSAASFPNTVADMDLMLIDLYGRLRNTYYHADSFRRIGILLSHDSDQGYNGSEFNEFGQNVVPPSTYTIGFLWNNSFENIAKCNSFFEALAKIRAGSLTDDQKKALNLMEGQAHFLRAFHYFYVINVFGESPITTEADKAKMGVPLWDKTAASIADANRERATQGQVWDFIINDLTQAETQLKGQVWDANNRPRVDEWAVKTFLGKAYAFTLQWDKARTKLKEVIDNSGKKLVGYNTLRTMFNGQNELNTESIFEVNFTPDQRDQWNIVKNTATYYGIFISPSYVDDDGSEPTNGFGNLFIHDENLRRYGFDDTTAVNQKRPDYVAKSLRVRQDKSVDPRLYVGTLQPYVDSLFANGKWRKVAKNRFEGFPGRDKKAWCHRKYVLVDRNIWEGDGASLGINMYVTRLADVYLLYAEALKIGGDNATALEYVNKIHRRAYDANPDVPSKWDYKTLADRTITADPTDPLANDPLRYERWAELFCEGHWWFDVRRWQLGPKEAAYYKKVMSGPLVWNDRKYAMPLPTGEINNNTKVKQNPGY